MDKQHKIEREDFLVWFGVFFVTILSILPYLASKIYSIDDYHLLNLYNLNWEPFFSRSNCWKAIIFIPRADL